VLPRFLVRTFFRGPFAGPGGRTGPFKLGGSGQERLGHCAEMSAPLCAGRNRFTRMAMAAGHPGYSENPYTTLRRTTFP
jgi:hypothetical protein